MQEIKQPYFQFHGPDGKMGIKSRAGKVLIPAVYDFISAGSEDCFQVQNADKWSYVDLEGREFIPPRKGVQFRGEFSEGFAVFRQNDCHGYINKQGDVVIEPQFIFAKDFKEGLAVVRGAEYFHGVIDRTGTLVIPYRYNSITDFVNGYARVSNWTDNLWGLINREGEVILERKYASLSDVVDHKVTVTLNENDDYRQGIYTIGGEIEWNHTLDAVNQLNDQASDLIKALDKYIDATYETGCPCQYARFRHFIDFDKPVRFVEQKFLFAYLKSKLIEKKREVDSDSALYECPVCGTVYKETSEQLSAALDFTHVTLLKKGQVTERGPLPAFPIPVVFGFQGYDRALLNQLNLHYRSGASIDELIPAYPVEVQF